MEAKKKQLVRSWLQRQGYLEEDESRGAVNRVVVHQVTATGKMGMEVGTLPLKYKPSSDDLSNYVDEISGMIDADAEGIGQQVRYTLIAWHRGESGESQGAKLTVLVKVVADEDDEGDILTDAPTAKGLVGQALRHAEIFAKMSSISAASTISALNRQVEKLQEQNAMLLDKNFEVMELVQTLTDRKHERDISTRESAVKIENKQEMFHKLMLILPIVANKIFSKDGKKLLPEKITTVESMMYGLAQTFKDNQFNQLMEIMSPEQRIAFGSIFQELQKFDMKKLGDGSDGSNGTNGTAS